MNELAVSHDNINERVSDNLKRIKSNEVKCPGWQETFDSALDITALISPNFEILKINKAGIRSLDMKPEEIIGQKCYKVVHGLDAPIDGCACKEAGDSGVGAESEICDRGRNYLTTAAPIYDEENNFVAFAHTVKDITLIKDAERSLIKTNDILEEKVKQRTADLQKLNEKLKLEINERKKTEKILQKSRNDLENQRLTLEQKNSALNEIITQIEIEKNKIKDGINTNIERIILPLLSKLQLQNETSSSYVDILNKHLKEITSQYGSRITKLSYKLTQREIELCNYIKSGLSSKEIASILNISIKTIDKHRRNIRKKLELTNSNVNLNAYLTDLS